MIRQQKKLQRSKRQGISLIEVIACTAIVSIMVVPIAGVIRASGRAIERSSQLNSEAKFRSGIRWIRDAVRSGTVVDVGKRNLTLVLASGQKMELIQDSDRLILSDGRTKTLILENVGRFECEQYYQSEGKNLPIGIAIRISGKDPQTGSTYEFDSLVATPPQEQS